MRNTLLWMLAAFMCVLVACANVTPVKDFSLEKMEGKWYLVGLATDAAWFVNGKAAMKMGTVRINVTPGGVNLSYANLNDDGTCWRLTHLANKTDTPGRFTFHSDTWGNHNDMRVVDVLYDDYAMVHTNKTRNGVSKILNKLYSRNPEVSDAVQEKFTQYAQDNGISADNIVMLPKSGECPEE